MNINYTRNQIVTTHKSPLSWKASTFETRKQMGKLGEYRVDYCLQFSGWIKVNLAEVDLYVANGYDRLLVDVSEHPYYQELDIDRLLFRSDGSYQSVEIKTHYKAKTSGNIFFEVAKKGNRPGWGVKSQADLWFFLIPGQELLIFERKNFKQLVEDLQPLQEIVGGEGNKGLLIPIERVKEQAYRRVDNRQIL